MKIIIFILTVLLSTTNCIAQFSDEHIITTEAIVARYVHAADINGDDFVDVIVASTGDNTLAWYENLDGLGNFGTKNVLSQFSVEFQFVSSGDIDGDGDLDILATALFDDLVIWFENLDGLGSFSSRKNISVNKDVPLTVFAADIDGDGDLDTYSSSKFDGVVAWYENTNGLGDFSVEHIITTLASVTTWAYAADIDEDGDMDMLATVAGNQSIYWYENLDGLGDFGLGNLIVNNLAGPQVVISDDLDNDSNLDVLSVEFGGNTIAWYENLDGLGSFGVKNIITTNVDAPLQIVSADLDNDGDQDVVSVSGADNKIAWYKNDGLGNFGAQQIIALSADGPRSIGVADFDGDGYQDVVSASVFDNKIAWYKNQTFLSVGDKLYPSIILSPNPTKSWLNVISPNSIIKTIKVYDMVGKQVLTQINNSKTINLYNLQAGLYIIKVETDIGMITKKVIKE